MKRPDTRAEFERNFHLLQDAIVNGRMSFAQGVSASIESLTRVRLLPNGRIDFLSVDEPARLLANTMSQEESFIEAMKNSQAAEQKEQQSPDETDE